MCGAEMRIIAFIVDRAIVRDILAHLGEPTALPPIAPARGPPLWDLPDARTGDFDLPAHGFRTGGVINLELLRSSRNRPKSRANARFPPFSTRAAAVSRIRRRRPAYGAALQRP
jgi:hypothetical protein